MPLNVFAVVGHPVLHSRSPEMHNKGFEELGLDTVYTRIAAENAEQAMKIAKELDVKGLNVTAPFKEDFLELVDEVDESAKRVGAINTVLFSEGKSVGFNTDVDGVKGALKANGVELGEKKVVVVGAGGAANAAVSALSAENAEIVIVNRREDFEKAEKLAKEFNCKAQVLEEGVLDEIISNAEVIVSCISTAERIIPNELLSKEKTVFEANYSEETALKKDAKEIGCKFIDGREWLLFQGVKAFELFTGEKAPEQKMREAVYASENNLKENIALIGFMGSGKTSIAKEIAKIRGRECINIDENIEKKAGISIKKIFEREGEEKFREKETEELKKLSEVKEKVIDCGGGIVLRKENVEILKDCCVRVLLLADVKTILKRTQGDERPLLDVEGKKEEIEKLLSDRMEKYVKSADLIVKSNGEINEIAELIVYENRKEKN